MNEQMDFFVTSLSFMYINTYMCVYVLKIYTLNLKQFLIEKQFNIFGSHLFHLTF